MSTSRWVQQREVSRPDDHPDHPDGPQFGDCYRACIASIFALPYEAVPDLRGDTQKMMAWLREFAPGVSVRSRTLGPVLDEHGLDSWKAWPTEHREDGYWIAIVRSPRIPDVETFGCGCADRVPGGDPACKWCHGEPGKRSMGIRWGLHAVVMFGWHLAWDPHPDSDGKIGPIRAAETFHLADPAPAIRALASFTAMCA